MTRATIKEAAERLQTSPDAVRYLMRLPKDDPQRLDLGYVIEKPGRSTYIVYKEMIDRVAARIETGGERGEESKYISLCAVGDGTGGTAGNRRDSISDKLARLTNRSPGHYVGEDTRRSG